MVKTRVKALRSKNLLLKYPAFNSILMLLMRLSLVVVICCILSACRNKTVILLTKKWDCMQVENIVNPNQKMLNPKDSANAEDLKVLLQSINWTFKNNMRYECALNERITVQGKYELLESDKIIICTPESKISPNRYIIKSLTADELVLAGNPENTNVVLHFRPH